MAGTLSGMGPEPGRPRAGATRRKPFPPPPFAPFGNGSDAVAQVRLAMQKIKDVLRLHLAGGVTSRRQLALVVGCGKTAVSDCLRRAQVAGLTDWPAVAALDEGELEARLYPSQVDSKLKGQRLRPAPDWAEIRAELARRDHQVTLALLWQEYKAGQPDGYQLDLPRFSGRVEALSLT